LIRVQNLKKTFGSFTAVNDVSFEVAPGEIFAFLGPNGAGKTTTLKVASGLHPAAAGDVFIAGRRVNGARADELACRGLCLVPEGRGVFPNLTVRENLWVMTYAGRSRSEIEEAAYARFPVLADRRHQHAGTLSGGEQQMLAMARGLATDPALLILDELSMGLAPLVVEQLYGLVADVAAEGVSILVVEQFARVVLGVASRAAVMVAGHIVHEGLPAEIEATLSESYLGAGETEH
jgi:branched-chain amino acid transport system ATP-binding protein